MVGSLARGHAAIQLALFSFTGYGSHVFAPVDYLTASTGWVVGLHYPDSGNEAYLEMGDDSSGFGASTFTTNSAYETHVFADDVPGSTLDFSGTQPQQLAVALRLSSRTTSEANSNGAEGYVGCFPFNGDGDVTFTNADNMVCSFVFLTMIGRCTRHRYLLTH